MSFYRSPSPWNNIQFGGCVVRFDTLSTSGNSVVPRIHANEAHINVGVTSVGIDWSEPSPRWLHFECENPGAIIAVGVMPDETMTGMGVTCGPSGGGPTTKVPIYKDGVQVNAHSLELYNPYANLWCWWMWWGGDTSPVEQSVVDLQMNLTALEARVAALEGS